MGDRGNIKVYQDENYNSAVYLYTHWSGSEILQVLKKALGRKQRWNDVPYLTRIIFCEMVKGEEDGETGFGITDHICDNEHTILGVDCDKQVVLFENENGTIKETVSFEDFVNGKFSPPSDLSYER